jgi:hypothetical protein
MGGGHGSGAPHPSQAKQAYLFGEKGKRKVEAWEHITSFVYWSAFLILVTGLWSSPETRIKVGLTWCGRGLEVPGVEC